MRHIRTVAAFIVFFIFSTPVHAHVVTFVKEYTYLASDFDSKYSSRIIALETVKRQLLEKLGTYLIGETEVKDMQLTKDQVTAYSAGIVSAEIIEEKWDGRRYWLKAKVSSDSGEVVKALKKLVEDRAKSEELEESRKKAQELMKEIEGLRKELEKNRQSKVKDTETYERTLKGLSAIEWFDKGNRAVLGGNWKDALDAFTRAIELKSDYAEAYKNRGHVYGNLDDYQQEIRDCSKAIELKHDYAEAYKTRGQAYGNLGHFHQAIEDYTRAIEMKHDLARVYYSRGTAYGSLGDHQRAIEDYSRAIELAADMIEAYHNRGVAYGNLGKYQHEIDDCSTAIELKPDYAHAYYARGIAYGYLGKNEEQLDDFKRAARLGLESARDFLTGRKIQW